MAALTAVALAALAVVLFVRAADENVGDDQLAESVAAAQLVDARLALESAALDLVLVRMLDGAGYPGDRTGRLNTAARDFESAIATIESLVAEGGLVGAEAAELLDDGDAVVLDDPVGGDLSELFYIAEDAARYTGVSEVVTTRTEAAYQLSFVGTLPVHAMIEAVAADVAVNDRVVEPEVASFFDEMIDVVRTEGGWFGVDAATPFVGSEWIEIDEARELLPVETARLSELTAASSIVAYDAWMRELGDGSALPPFEVAEMVVEADRLSDELSNVIDALIADDNDARMQEAAARRSNRTTMLVLGAASGALAMVMLLVSARANARASRRHAKLAMSDALTAVGNRRELDARTRAFAADPRFDRHLVAMIDLDRFKLVNDTHGHAVGDAILTEVASKLQEIASDATTGQRGAESSVVRLGGDEFLLTLHGSDTLDLDAVRVRLDDVRREHIEHAGSRIELAYSVGIVEAEGRQDLADLMRQADLAVYNDKARRGRGSDVRSGATALIR